MDRRGTDYIPVARTEEIERLEKSLEAFGEAIGTSPANLRLKDL